MKNILFSLLCLVITSYSQDFHVEKVSGEVKYLLGTSENWETVLPGQILSANTLILAENNSFVRLKKGDEIFLLRGDAAIGLNHLKEVSINDLILALTLDEIRNVPRIKNNGLSKNTAVYGSKIERNEKEIPEDKYLGEKKIKGAKQLSQSGYRESSIIAAKEIFRNYPSINNKFDERIYFADLLFELELFEEAIEDYVKISEMDLSKEENKLLNRKMEKASLKLAGNN